MTTQYIRERITELRLQKNVSEYQMSLDLGQNKTYIQGISSGRSLPSMKQFFNICKYFDITPLEFFDNHSKSPALYAKAKSEILGLSEDDVILLLGFINRLKNK